MSTNSVATELLLNELNVVRLIIMLYNKLALIPTTTDHIVIVIKTYNFYVIVMNEYTILK